MSDAVTPRAVAELYLERSGAFWAAPDAPEPLAAILDLFADDAVLDLPGSDVVPWGGKRSGREEIAAFYRALAGGVEPRHYEVRRVLADDGMAAVLGNLGSFAKAAQRMIETPFLLEFTVSNGKITRLLVLEDSFAVAKAFG